MLARLFPALEWLRNYRRADWKADLSAGFTAAVMLVPQSMAYALLAGLPPVMGLYASTIPLIVYALWGSSRQLAVGPVAMVSLLVATGVSPLAPPGSEEYVGLALLLAFLVGVLQLAMGLVGLGFVVHFFSHAVIRGFTAAAAILILLGQMKHLLGIPLANHHSVPPLIAEIAYRLGETNPVTLTMGLVSIAILVFFSRKNPRFPAALLVVAAGTLAAFFWHLDRWQVATVGLVPRGLPRFSLPPVNLAAVQGLAGPALTIFLVGFMESIAVAKLIAARERYKVDANQELRALGLANIAAAFFSGYPVTGGFSRTAVNYQAGARTGLASIITAFFLLLTLFWLTPLFYYLPQTVLAAIVMVAVVGLIDLPGARRLFQVKPSDGWTLLVTMGATLILGVEGGLLIGVVFSLMLFIWRSAHPHTAELGYLEGEEVFRNIARYPEAKTYPEALLLRIDASLYFANMRFVEDRLRERIVEKPHLKWVILDLSGVNDIDGGALETLEALMEDYHGAGIEFLFAGMKGPVRDLVAKAGWPEKYGDRIDYLSVKHALQAVGLT